MNDQEQWDKERLDMIQLLSLYGIRDARVLEAMGRIPRHRFIPEPFRQHLTAYGDHPCPIGHGQTLSQPFIVAHMTERLNITPDDRVLEIGTGSGYQSAVLAELGAAVYTLEIVEALALHATAVLTELGYGNRIHHRGGDGHQGWPEAAPFDAIIVTCGPESVPQPLIDQLVYGGRMILPVGPQGNQHLVLIRKTRTGIHPFDDIAVRFVPMV